MVLTDKKLQCRECGREFVFTIGEQVFFQEKGFTHEPARCRDCRKARKAAQGKEGAVKTNFKVV